MQKYKINSNIFDRIDCPEKAYYLGFLWADGYLNKNSNVVALELGEKDYAHLQNVALFLNYPLNKIRYRKERNTYRMSFSDKALASALRSLNFKGHNYKEVIPQEFILDFLRGFFDGDGSVYSQGKTSFCTSFVGTEQMLRKIMEDLPYYKKIREVSTSKGTFRIETHGIDSSMAVCNSLYSRPPYLQRKYNKYTFYKKLHEKTSTTKLDLPFSQG